MIFWEYDIMIIWWYLNVRWYSESAIGERVLRGEGERREQGRAWLPAAQDSISMSLTCASSPRSVECPAHLNKRRHAYIEWASRLRPCLFTTWLLLDRDPSTKSRSTHLQERVPTLLPCRVSNVSVREAKGGTSIRLPEVHVQRGPGVLLPCSFPWCYEHSLHCIIKGKGLDRRPLNYEDWQTLIEIQSSKEVPW